MRRFMVAGFASILLCTLSVAQEQPAKPIVRVAYAYSDPLLKDVVACEIYQGTPPLLVTSVGDLEKRVSRLYFLRDGKAVAATDAEGNAILGSEFSKADHRHGGVRDETPSALWYREKWEGHVQLLTIQDGKVIIHEQRLPRGIGDRRLTFQAGRYWVTVTNWKTETEGDTRRTERWVELWYTDGAALKRAVDADGAFVSAGETISVTQMADGGFYIDGTTVWVMRDGVCSPVTVPRAPKDIRWLDTQSWPVGYSGGVLYIGSSGSKRVAGLWRLVEGEPQWINDSEGVPFKCSRLTTFVRQGALWVRASQDIKDAAGAVSEQVSLYRVKGDVAHKIKCDQPISNRTRFVAEDACDIIQHDTESAYEYMVIEGDTLKPITLPDGGTLTSTRGYAAWFCRAGEVLHAWLPKHGRYRVKGTSAVQLEDSAALVPASAVLGLIVHDGVEIVSWVNPENSSEYTFGLVNSAGKIEPLQREQKEKLWDMGHRAWSCAQGPDGVYFASSVRGTRGPFAVYYLE